MDWTTKEYMDQKFNDIEDSLELIMDKLGISAEDDDSEDETETNKEDKELDF